MRLPSAIIHCFWKTRGPTCPGTVGTLTCLDNTSREPLVCRKHPQTVYLIMASLARKLAPLADRILIRRLVAQTQTAGGIYLPDSNVGKTNEGEVIAVGPGRVTESGTKIPVSVSVGDTVLLPEYGGQTLKLGNEEVSLFRDEDILGKFEG